MTRVHSLQDKNTDANQIAFENKHNISGRYFIVTGTTAGLGLENVRVLLKHGGIVTSACRNTTLMKEQIDKLKSDNPNLEINSHIIKCDLSDFSSIKQFNHEQRDTVGKLDVLINNAGILNCPGTEQTKDGLEMVFGTNHYGHFLLTGLLQDLLFQSDNMPRVITVSSEAHEWVKNMPDKKLDFKNMKPYEDLGRNQGLSKMANIQFTKGLVKKWGEKVKCQSLHPGVIKTEVLRNINCCFICIFDCLHCLGAFELKTYGQGTATQVYAAVSDEVLKQPNGEQLADCAISPLKTDQFDDDESGLMEYSEEVTNVKINTI